MKPYIFRIVLTAIVAVFPLSAAAQNLDPTVEVSRQYEGKLMEVHKPLQKMAVPDSVLRFDLDFDYSVSDKPYKGAYEFSPYVLDMKPSATVRNINTFYLNAGAGYQLHPTLDLVWSPKFKAPLRMNVYGTHRSYFGKYWTIGESAGVLDRLNDVDGKPMTWNGHDMISKAGVDGRYDWEKALLCFDLGYSGLHQQQGAFETLPQKRMYNGTHAHLGFASKDTPATRFSYKADVSYKLAWDKAELGLMSMNTNELSIAANAGFRMKKGHTVALDLGIESISTSGTSIYYGSDVSLVPHYIKSAGKWHFDIGVRFSPAHINSLVLDTYGIRSRSIYPDVRIEFKAIPELMKLYVDLGGDSQLVSYSDLLEYNRYITPAYAGSSHDLINVSDTKIDAAFGITGQIAKRFSYNLKGGYAGYSNALLDCVLPEVGEDLLLPGIAYAEYAKAYADLDMFLNLENLQIDGNLRYTYLIPSSINMAAGLFAPPAFTGDFNVTYNWKKRIFAGINCKFAASRKGFMPSGTETELTLPGYADLGLSLEYVMTRKISLWAQGGNLLGMTIQRNPLYAEKGPYFTVGIALNL